MTYPHTVHGTGKRFGTMEVSPVAISISTKHFEKTIQVLRHVLLGPVATPYMPLRGSQPHV